MGEYRGITHGRGYDTMGDGDVTVARLQQAIVEANQRLNCGWLCCVIDRTGWLPLDHWYPDEPRAPDVPHPVALSRQAEELVSALERYVRNFHHPVTAPPPAPRQCEHTPNDMPRSCRNATLPTCSAAPLRMKRTSSGSITRLPPRRPKTRVGDEAIPPRCPGHLAFVRGHACSVAGPDCDGPVEAAHVRRGTGAGMGTKPDDGWTISLCRWHHHQQHAVGEVQFERMHGIDLKALAQEFARRSPSWQHLVAKCSARNRGS